MSWKWHFLNFLLHINESLQINSNNCDSWNILPILLEIWSPIVSNATYIIVACMLSLLMCSYGSNIVFWSCFIIYLAVQCVWSFHRSFHFFWLWVLVKFEFGRISYWLWKGKWTDLSNYNICWLKYLLHKLSFSLFT